MINRQEIIDYFKKLCNSCGKKLLRTEYREMNPKYSSSLIENIWGNWTNFTEEVDNLDVIVRHNVTKIFSEDLDKIVITAINDGSHINLDFYNTLISYCAENEAELGILWGKPVKKHRTFTQETFDLISPYLATKFEFKRDPSCIAQDFLIPNNQKNPLLNLDKLSTDIKTIIVGASKQYLQILPYKQYTTYRVACSTGTLSEIEYKETVTNQMDAKYHKFGAILLEWNKDIKRYVIRNLIYKDGCICDLDKKYIGDKIENIDKLPAMVLGDLHLPDENDSVFLKTKNFIKQYKPEYTMLHDIASWNSVCHHNFGKCLTQAINLDHTNTTLEDELEIVLDKIEKFTKNLDTNFKIVNSNHDAFIEKWLETGEFVKDKHNSVIGAKLFVDYVNGKNILEDKLPKNVQYLPKNTEFKICGFTLSEHGDAGISGANGSPNAYNKTFENCICGHTHSPKIVENTVYVGTLSELIVNYNQKGMTNWVNCNAIIQENGTVQLLFL